MKATDFATLEYMVLCEYPGTSRATTRAIAYKAKGDPLLLKGFLRLRVITQSINRLNEAIELAETDIESLNLPRSSSHLLVRLRADFPDSLNSMMNIPSIDRAISVADWLLHAKDVLIDSVEYRDDTHLDGDVYSWIDLIDELIYDFVASNPTEWFNFVSETSISDDEVRSMRWAIIDRLMDVRDSESWEEEEYSQRLAILRRIHATFSELFVDEEFHITCRIDLAILEASEYRFAEAVELLDGHLPTDVHTHVEVLMRSYLSDWLLELDRTDEAVMACEMVVEGWIHLLGIDHPDTLGASVRLVHALGKNDCIEKAIDLSRLLVINHTRVFGPDDSRTLSVRSSLAIWVSRNGDDEEAIELHRQLADDFERVLGPHHQDTFSVRNNLACLLRLAGYDEEGTSLLRDTLEVMTEVLGPDHPDTLLARENLIGRQDWDPDSD